jgi:hypothetical protein
VELVEGAYVMMQPRADWRHVLKLAREKGWGKTSDPAVFQPVDNSPVGDANATETPDNDSGEGAQGDIAQLIQPGQRFIRVSDAALDTNVEQLNLLMEPTVFTQATSLVRLSRAHDAEIVDDVKRAADQLVIARVTKGWSRTHAMSECEFYRFDKRARAENAWVRCSCPDELVGVWMDQGDWPKLKPLDAIARAPFVRADGSICDQAGYDAGSHALYIPSEAYPAIPEAPTRADARSALDGIRRVFDQFPWETPASESAFLAHVLTEAARLAVDRVPMFWYSAPNAGTGKSLLSEMAAIIVHGTEPALRPWVQNGDELRKTLFASLLAGDRSIAFDNVPTGHKARAPELCAFLTSAVWKDRKLGVSETHAVPNRAVVSASGNNVTPVSDLARRCLVVRLDANTERMKERRFKIDNLRGYVMAHRDQLLVHALTVIKAYHAAPTVHGLPVPLPSFERWSRMVRDPLLWLGLPDPCETQSETDDETGSLGATFEKLVSHFGECEFTAIDIAGLAGGVADSHGELTALLLQSGCSEPHSSVKVGYWLRGERGKISAGFKLVHGIRSSHGMKFRFKRVNEDLS